MSNIFDSLDSASVTSTPQATPTRRSGTAPAPSLGKRPRLTDDAAEGSNELSPSMPISAALSLCSSLQLGYAGNSLTFAKSLISGKRFKQSQVDAVERFAQAMLDERLIMLYVTMLGGQDPDDVKSVEMANWNPSKNIEVSAVYTCFTLSIPRRHVMLCSHVSLFNSAIRRILRNDQEHHGPAMDLSAELRDEAVAETVVQIERLIEDSFRAPSAIDEAPVSPAAAAVEAAAGAATQPAGEAAA